MKHSRTQSTKVDGFYNEALHILHTPKTQVRFKLRSGASVVTKPTVEKIERFTCINVDCRAEHNVFETNIRGRILRGYLVTSNGRTTVQHSPGTPVKPCYHNGRLCEKCSKQYNVSASVPTDYTTIQLLKDFAKINPNKVSSVTRGEVEHEDVIGELGLEQLQKDARPKHGKFAIEVGKVPTKESSKDEIHIGAFHKFMAGRGGGLKDYHKNPVKRFDAEVNYQNQKKGR